MSGRNSNTAAERKAKDDWRTPGWLWERLNRQYNFGVDCAATRENTLCDLYIQEGDDPGFACGDLCVVWCNPPFSNPKMLTEHWVDYTRRVGIYRCDNLETKAWQQIILPNVDWVFFFAHRINYEGHEGKGAMFPSALFGAGVPPPEGLNGTLVRIK